MAQTFSFSLKALSAKVLPLSLKDKTIHRNPKRVKEKEKKTILLWWISVLPPPLIHLSKIDNIHIKVFLVHVRWPLPPPFGLSTFFFKLIKFILQNFLSNHGNPPCHLSTRAAKNHKIPYSRMFSKKVRKFWHFIYRYKNAKYMKFWNFSTPWHAT